MLGLLCKGDDDRDRRAVASFALNAGARGCGAGPEIFAVKGFGEKNKPEAGA
jgi:hypothetical protein